MSKAMRRARRFIEAEIIRDPLGRFAVKPGGPKEQGRNRLDRPVGKGSEVGSPFFHRYLSADQSMSDEASKISTKMEVNAALNARIRQHPGWEADMLAAASVHPLTEGPVRRNPLALRQALEAQSVDQAATREAYRQHVRDTWPEVVAALEDLRSSVRQWAADGSFHQAGADDAEALIEQMVRREGFEDFGFKNHHDLKELRFHLGLANDPEVLKIIESLTDKMPVPEAAWEARHGGVMRPDHPVPDTDDGVRAEYALRQFTEQAIRQWAATSSGRSTESHMTQEAARSWAARRFPDSALDHGDHFQDVPEHLQAIEMMEKSPAIQKGYDRLFDAMHEETQERLERLGIEDVVVYRGMSFGDFPWEGGEARDFRDAYPYSQEAVTALAQIDPSDDLGLLLEQYVTESQMGDHLGVPGFEWSDWSDHFNTTGQLANAAGVILGEDGYRDELTYTKVRADIEELYEELVPQAIDLNKWDVTTTVGEATEAWKSYFRMALEEGDGFATSIETFNRKEAERSLRALEYDVDASEVGGAFLNPLTSWSSSLGVAAMFSDGVTGGGHSSGSNGVVIRVTVPRERVLGTSVTGFGALDELEFVLLGQPLQSFRVTHNE